MNSSRSQNRKDLKRAYKETPEQAGIWLIRNLKNGKVLLGESINLGGRINRHRFVLNTGKHECKELQTDWNNLGPQNFSFEEAELLKKPDDNPYFDLYGELKRLEKSWLDKLQPYGEKGYHSAP
jgi:hypothetical protein